MFRRKAKWIYWREKGIKQCKCSKCKVSYGCIDTPYCPNCGRKMVGAIKGKEVWIENLKWKWGIKILSEDLKGKRCAGCGQCVHANYDKMKCYPDSGDCKKEYDLTEEDFHTETRCDFFKSK